MSSVSVKCTPSFQSVSQARLLPLPFLSHVPPLRLHRLLGFCPPAALKPTQFQPPPLHSWRAEVVLFDLVYHDGFLAELTASGMLGSASLPPPISNTTVKTIIHTKLSGSPWPRTTGRCPILLKVGSTLDNMVYKFLQNLRLLPPGPLSHALHGQGHRRPRAKATPPVLLSQTALSLLVLPAPSPG